MPKPFPLPISIGTDVCSTQRILSILTRQPGTATRFIARVLGEQERAAPIAVTWRIEEPISRYWALVDQPKGVGKGSISSSSSALTRDVREFQHDGEKEKSVAEVHTEVFGANGLGKRGQVMTDMKMLTRLLGVDLRSYAAKKFSGGTKRFLEMLLRGTEEKARQEAEGERMLLRQVPLERMGFEGWDAMTKYWGEWKFWLGRYKEAEEENGVAGREMMAQACLAMWRLYPRRPWADKGTAAREVVEDELHTEEGETPENVNHVEDATDNVAMEGDETLQIHGNPGILGETGDADKAAEEVIMQHGETTPPKSKDDGATNPQVERESRTYELNKIIPRMHRSAEWLAGRYAAKEAAIKAHRSRKLRFHDIWIKASDPVEGLTVAPEALIISKEGSWENAQVVPMSISHDSGYATAVCLALEDADGVVHEDGNAPRSTAELAQLANLTSFADSSLATALGAQRSSERGVKPRNPGEPLKVRKVVSGTYMGHHEVSPSKVIIREHSAALHHPSKHSPAPTPENQGPSITYHRVYGASVSDERDMAIDIALKNRTQPKVPSNIENPHKTRRVEILSADEEGIPWLAELLGKSQTPEDALRRAQELVHRIRDNPAAVTAAIGKKSRTRLLSKWAPPPTPITARTGRGKRVLSAREIKHRVKKNRIAKEGGTSRVMGNNKASSKRKASISARGESKAR